MNTTQARRAARPTTRNRAESMAALLRDLVSDRPAQERRLAEDDPVLDDAIARQQLFGISSALGTRFSVQMDVASVQLMTGDAEGWQRMAAALATLYRAAEIDQADALRDGFDFSSVEPLLLLRIWLFALAAREGADDLIDWLTPWLLNALAGDSASKTPGLCNDAPFRVFHACLLQALVDGRWPVQVDMSAAGHYGPLLSTVDAPDAFRAALVDFCDRRLALSLGFDDLQAARRRPPSAMPITVLDNGGWESLWPIELFSLRHVHARVTGRRLSLQAEHPLLMSPLMQGSVGLLPFADDAWTLRLDTIARAILGPDWQPLQRVALR